MRNYEVNKVRNLMNNYGQERSFRLSKLRNTQTNEVWNWFVRKFRSK